MNDRGRAEGRGWVAITGAASGIGLATANRVARDHSVLLIDRNAEELEAARAKLAATPREIRAAIADVTDQERVAAAFASLPEGDVVRGLVNCAGIFDHHPAAEMPLEAWQRVLEVNLTGTFICCQQAYRRMRPGSVVVNISSIGGKAGLSGRSNYAASKAGVAMLTKCLAVEWAADGIRVVTVTPGQILTPMVQRAIDRGLQSHETVARRVPLRRFGRPEEVANVIAFLLSDEASYLTGVDVPIDGGWLAFGAM